MTASRTASRSQNLNVNTSLPSIESFHTPDFSASLGQAESQAAVHSPSPDDFGASLHRCTNVIAGLIRRPAYQRHLSPSLVSEIATFFDPLQFKRLIVSRRDNEYWIVDGGHRLEGVIVRGFSSTAVPVLLYENLTYQQEATLFRSQRTSRTLSPADYFRADLEAREPTALAIRSIVEARGFVLNLDTTTPEPGKITAIGALRSVHRLGSDHLLRETMQVLASLYHEQPIANWDIKGFALFLRWFPLASRARVVQSLRALGYTALRQSAVAHKGITGSDYATGVAATLHQHYNSSLRSNSPELLSPFDVRALRSKMGGLTRTQRALENPAGDD